MENKFNKDKVREPITDFVNLIEGEKEKGATPSTFVLNFRDWQQNNHEEPVHRIKTEFLRFRKDNGRISSDVETFEKLETILKEESPEAQIHLREFLWNKSPDRIKQLMNLLKHSGQTEPAIITCDGFLVNGNRRKLALEKLYEEEKDEKYRWMKVVILPRNATIQEIEQVENRYQYHSDGKEEYTNFDKALSIRGKIRRGITLEMQLQDDPEYASLSRRKQKHQLKKIETEYLGTLECIDTYLESLGRPGVYRSVAEGPGDKSGRWEAFMTFNQNTFSKLQDPKERALLEIRENEVGKVVDSAFKILRKRDLKTGRLNDVMRKFPKMLKNDLAKKEILKVSNNPMELTQEEITRDGKEIDVREQDKIWGGKYGSEIINSVIKATHIIDEEKLRDKPIDILDQALKKLEHDDLDLEDINPLEIEQAMEIVDEISDRAESIYSELDKLRFKFKKFKDGDWGH